MTLPATPTTTRARHRANPATQETPMATVVSLPTAVPAQPSLEARLDTVTNLLDLSTSSRLTSG